MSAGFRSPNPATGRRSTQLANRPSLQSAKVRPCDPADYRKSEEDVIYFFKADRAFIRGR